MDIWQNSFDQHFDKLKTHRDELNLKMHLAKADARDYWQHWEKRFEQTRATSTRIFKEVSRTGNDLIEDFKLAGDDIKAGYQRIKKQLH
jgi:hypothetical protein